MLGSVSLLGLRKRPCNILAPVDASQLSGSRPPLSKTSSTKFLPVDKRPKLAGGATLEPLKVVGCPSKLNTSPGRPRFSSRPKVDVGQVSELDSVSNIRNGPSSKKLIKLAPLKEQTTTTTTIKQNATPRDGINTITAMSPPEIIKHPMVFSRVHLLSTPPPSQGTSSFTIPPSLSTPTPDLSTPSPSSGNDMRTCACGNNKGNDKGVGQNTKACGCVQVALRSCSNNILLGWVSLPSDQYRRELFCRHLGINSINADGSRIAKHHFHAEAFRDDGRLIEICSHALGLALGYTKSDEVPGRTDGSFYHVPNVSAVEFKGFLTSSSALTAEERSWPAVELARVNAEEEAKAKLEQEVKIATEGRRKEVADRIEETKKENDEIRANPMIGIRKLAALRDEIKILEEEKQEREKNLRSLEIHVKSAEADRLEAKALLQSLEDNHEKMNALYGREFKVYMKAKKDACRHTDGSSDCSTAASFVMAGVSRFTLTSAAFHELNPAAAEYIFGMRSFAEMIIYYETFFPGKKATTMHDVVRDDASKSYDSTIFISDFESWLISIMTIKTGWEQTAMGFVWGRDQSTISGYLTSWRKRIKWCGDQMAILNVNLAWVKAEQPSTYDDVGMIDNISFVVDGKDIQWDTIRGNALIAGLQYSDKSSGSAARIITFSGKSGIVLEFTCPFFGRASETAIMKLWGSYRNREVPLESWKFVQLLSVPENEPLNQALPEGRKNADIKGDGLKRKLIRGMSNYASSRASAQAVTDKRMSAAAADEAAADEAAATKGKANVPIVAAFLKKYYDLKAHKDDMKKKKLNSAWSIADIEACQQRELADHPFQTRESTIAHFTLHERFHIHFEAGDLKPNLFSFYLWVMVAERRAILRHLGSSMVLPSWAPDSGPLPRLFPRLQKFPKETEGLGDKGFHKDQFNLPNHNEIHTPIRLDGRLQYTNSEIKEGKINKTNRYTCEVVYSRVTDCKLLRDRLPRWHFRNLIMANSWAHGRANLQQPLLKPKLWDFYINHFNN